MDYASNPPSISNLPPQSLHGAVLGSCTLRATCKLCTEIKMGKREQVARACVACSAGKLRCSGTFPCKRCTSKGQQSSCCPVLKKSEQDSIRNVMESMHIDLASTLSVAITGISTFSSTRCEAAIVHCAPFLLLHTAFAFSPDWGYLILFSFCRHHITRLSTFISCTERPSYPNCDAYPCSFT